ncbi:MAG: glycosyltransferase family 4 protein [Planctomycetaceae bacterium]
MKLLIIAHDDVDLIDRRIINEARVFVERGWDVQINLITRAQRPVTRMHEPGIALNARPLWWFEPPYDPVYHGPRRLFDFRTDAVNRMRFRLSRFPRLRFAARCLLRTFRFFRRGAQRLTQGDVEPPPEILESYPLPFTLGFLEQAKEESFDAVMACDLLALPAARELAGGRGVPLIYDAHEYYVEQGTLSQKQKETLVRHESRCLRDAVLSFTVSDMIAEEITQRYQLERPMRVLYNAAGFPADAESADPHAARETLGIPRNDAVLLYHGGIIGNRNLARLVTAFRELDAPSAHLVLLGDGNRTAMLQRLSAGCARIHRHPAVPQEELPAWIHAADAVVIPYPATEKNNEYCMPNKFSDCVELSCPVVANSGLKMIERMLSEYRMGVSGPMDSDDDMTATLGRALDWLRHGESRHADFASAQRRLGWKTQRGKLRTWLGDVGLPGFARAKPEPCHDAERTPVCV